MENDNDGAGDPARRGRKRRKSRRSKRKLRPTTRHADIPMHSTSEAQSVLLTGAQSVPPEQKDNGHGATGQKTRDGGTGGRHVRADGSLRFRDRRGDRQGGGASGDPGHDGGGGTGGRGRRGAGRGRGRGRADAGAHPADSTRSHDPAHLEKPRKGQGSARRRGGAQSGLQGDGRVQEGTPRARNDRTTRGAQPARRQGGHTGHADRTGGHNKPRPQRGPSSPDSPLYAALDLGTNNCRLLVAEPTHGSFRVVDAFSRIVRLGEGLASTGRLSDGAIERALDALSVCAAKMRDQNVVAARLIATEACRIAENGPYFIEQVRARTGLELEIVSRETEARLAVAGCASLIDPKAGGVVLFDIGGGSSELVWLDFKGQRVPEPGAAARHIRCWTSLPVGVVTLSERHGGVSVCQQVFEDMVADVQTMLGQFEERAVLRDAILQGRVHMLGTSGTVTTLAGVHLGLKRYDRRRVDGAWLSAHNIDAMIGELLRMEFDERVANPCIGADRADLVLAGCAILEAIRREWPCERLRVADRGLREGILIELMTRDKVWGDRAGRGRVRARHGRGRAGQRASRPVDTPQSRDARPVPANDVEQEPDGKMSKKTRSGARRASRRRRRGQGRPADSLADT